MTIKVLTETQGVCICMGMVSVPLGRGIYIKPEAIGRNREGGMCIYMVVLPQGHIYTYEGVCCREPLSEPLPESASRVASRATADLAGCLLCS